MKLASLLTTSRPIPPQALNALLDSLPQAALLVHNGQRILACNHKTLELSTYTRAEIEEIPLSTLIQNEEGDARLITHRGLQVPIKVTRQPLDAQGGWDLILLRPVEIHGDEEGEATPFPLPAEALLTLVEQLPLASQHSRPDEALRQCLTAGANCLPPQTSLAIYLANSKEPGAQCVMAIPEGEHPFPAEIPADSIPSLRAPTLWRRGEPPTGTLHQTVEAHGSGYLLTQPLPHNGEERAWTGFLSITGAGAPPPILSFIGKTLSAFAETILQLKTQTTGLQRQIASLKDRTLQLGAAWEMTSDGVILIDEQFRILEMNPAAEILLGYASSEVQNAPLETVLVTSHVLQSALQAAIRGETTPIVSNVHLHHREGKAFPADISVFPIRQKAGKTNILILIKDITLMERHQLEALQLQQRALLGEFTAVFAHEVRNPINNLSVGLQLLAERFREDAETSERVQLMMEDCQRLSTLMDSVLTFSRTGNYTFQRVDLYALLERLLKRWHPRLAKSNIHYSLRAEGDIPAIQGDPNALEQVFVNLISNAVRAMEESGGNLALKLSARSNEREKQMVQVDCADSGCGIPPEVVERIFEPFFTTHPGGTGLGLSLAKQIITAHKGRITLTTQPGMTIFHVILPAAPSEEKQP